MFWRKKGKHVHGVKLIIIKLYSTLCYLLSMTGYWCRARVVISYIFFLILIFFSSTQNALSKSKLWFLHDSALVLLWLKNIRAAPPTVRYRERRYNYATLPLTHYGLYSHHMAVCWLPWRERGWLCTRHDRETTKVLSVLISKREGSMSVQK